MVEMNQRFGTGAVVNDWGLLALHYESDESGDESCTLCCSDSCH